MLDIHRKDVFKYHLVRALERSDMREDHQQTFIANVLSQATQNSISDAKGYISSVVHDELLDSDTADRIERLLDKYATHR
jgi:hypothetical protein